MRIFVTGACGFIGFHLCLRLLAAGHSVNALDGMTSYYDVALKRGRLAILQSRKGFTFQEAMLADRDALRRAVVEEAPDAIVHLAAQAGVRYALEAPAAYVESNIDGTFNLLEMARERPPAHLLFASTSSVYGANEKTPFAETDRTDFPVSLYAATKKAGEAMCHSYAHLFGIPTTAFRFFTVYGPWGRPDMALFKFVRAIFEGKPIDVYGHGRMRRDFTYVDDLVAAIADLIEVRPEAGIPHGADSVSPVAPYRCVNIAGGQPVELMEFISAIEKSMGREAQKRFLPMQPGDVVQTWSDPTLLGTLTGTIPATPISVGVDRFVEWYRDYYGLADAVAHNEAASARIA